MLRWTINYKITSKVQVHESLLSSLKSIRITLATHNTKVFIFERTKGEYTNKVKPKIIQIYITIRPKDKAL